jgi:hypothetical protein
MSSWLEDLKKKLAGTLEEDEAEPAQVVTKKFWPSKVVEVVEEATPVTKNKRGRPKKEVTLSQAERARRYREKRKLK